MLLQLIPSGLLVFGFVVMLLVGALECFAGFKLRKIMVSVWMLFLGMFIGVVIGFMNESASAALILAPAFGITLAVLAYKLYAVGLFVMVSTLSAAAALIFSESVLVAVIVGAAAGATMYFFVKTVVILSTALSGAAMLAAAAFMIMGVHNFSNMTIMYVLWVLFAAAGVACQYITTSKKLRGRLAGQKKYIGARPLTYSERRYPGMQRAYRNFCINCGCALTAGDRKCPRCRFTVSDE